MELGIWYPSSEPSGATIRYDGLLPGSAFPEIPADCSEARPVVAFSHGFAGVRYQSPFLTERLATHGYVVVAPDHRDNTFLDAAPDIAEIARRRPTDLRDTVDWLFAASEDPSSLWAGCVDPEVPALVLTGARDEITPLSMVQGLWDPIVSEPRWLGVFPDAGHYSFSPIACALNVGDGCGPDYLDEATFTERVNEAVLAFLDGARGVPGGFDRLPLDAPEITWEQD